MSWLEKARGWFPSRAGSAAGGYVGGKLRKALRSSPERFASDPMVATNTEQLIGTAVVTTVCKFDSKSEPALRKGQARLVTAAGAAQIAVADVEREKREDVQRGRLRRIKEQDEREQKTLAAPIDHAVPLVSRRVVTGAEILLSLVESGFWYLVFSASIDRRVSLLSSQRLSAIGLALFIPVLGVLAARLAGPAWQRALRYPTSDKHLRRNQIAAAALSTVLLLAAGAASWYLVSWRYSENNPSNIFAVLPPGWCMALLFVGSIIMLTLMRAFGDSEQHTINTQRDSGIVADRAAIKQTHDRTVTAHVNWVTAWTALRQLVNVGLNEIERMVATAEYILVYNRGRHAEAPRTQPAKTGEPTTETGLRYHLDVKLIIPQLRVHASAVQTLADYKPPTLGPVKQLADFSQSAAGQVNDLNNRIKAILDHRTMPRGPGADTSLRKEPTVDTSAVNKTPISTESVLAADEKTTTESVVNDLLLNRVNGHDRA